MTNSAVKEPATESFTCHRCKMTVQWMTGHEAPAQPAHWSVEAGELHCLACRRDLAAEAGVDDLPEDTPLDKRVQAKTRARLDFEVTRDPERGDGEIAKACRSTVAGVKKARERLGITA
jgi:hypothetical protein